MFDEQEEQVPMMPSKQKVEQCIEETAESVTEIEGIKHACTL